MAAWNLGEWFDGGHRALRRPLVADQIAMQIQSNPASICVSHERPEVAS
jgi:hypothetical protein